MSSDEPHLINISAQLAETEITEMISINVICRLCANQSEKLIEIYGKDGVSNDLSGKINLYLPIKVSETDNMPLQCCWQCASTVLAWHDLVITTVEADRRLKSYQKDLVEITYGGTESLLVDNEDETLAADDSVSKETILYETFTEANLLDEDVALKIEEHIQKNKENTFQNSKLNSVNNEIYISVRKDIIANDTSADYKIESVESTVQSEPAPNTHSVDKDSFISEQSSSEEHMYSFECTFCPTLFVAESDVTQHLKKEHSELKPDILINTKDAEEREPKKKVKSKPGKKIKKKYGSHRNFHVRNMIKQPLPKINQEEVNKAKVEVDGRVFYICKECGKSLHSMYTYVWHMRIHTGERPYVCDLCGKQFRVSQGLVRHLKETHERIKNFNCDICGRYFATKRNVEEHRRIHTNERPYVCSTCGKSFKQKASLFVHNRSHSTEFPFLCSYCSQKFRTKQSLLTHVTRHTGEKPFPCEVCGRNFRIKYELKRHKLIHSEDKPFTCIMCTQAFRQKRYLRNHLKLNHHLSDPTETLQECLKAN